MLSSAFFHPHFVIRSTRGRGWGGGREKKREFGEKKQRGGVLLHPLPFIRLLRRLTLHSLQRPGQFLPSE